MHKQRACLRHEGQGEKARMQKCKGVAQAPGGGGVLCRLTGVTGGHHGRACRGSSFHVLGKRLGNAAIFMSAACHFLCMTSLFSVIISVCAGSLQAPVRSLRHAAPRAGATCCDRATAALWEQS